MQHPAIELENLWFAYGASRVLDQVSLTLPAGVDYTLEYWCLSSANAESAPGVPDETANDQAQSTRVSFCA